MKEFNFEKELLGVQDELFRFAYKLTANREKAEDLLQDTLLKAMLHKESYNKNTNFKNQTENFHTAQMLLSVFT